MRAPPSARPTPALPGTCTRGKCVPGASVGQSGRAGGSLHVFGQFARLQVGSDKVPLSRPGRAPGWCPSWTTYTPL